MRMNTCEMWFNGIKIAVFKKLQKITQQLGVSLPKPPATRGIAPRPQSMIHLSYTGFLNTSQS